MGISIPTSQVTVETNWDNIIKTLNRGQHESQLLLLEKLTCKESIGNIKILS
jgi:hypothetical protein